MSRFVEVPLEVGENAYYNLHTDENARFTVVYVGTTEPSDNYAISRRGAASHAIEFILRGKGTVISSHNQKTVRAGDCLVLRQHADFMLRSDKEEPLYKIWLCVKGRLADKLLDSYGIFEDVTVVRADISEEMEQIYKEISEEDDDSHVAILFHSILHKLTLKIEQEIRAGRNAVAMQICSILDESIFSEISLDEIAARFFISKGQMIRIFRKEFGVTPYKYFLNKKLDTAKGLLQNTDLPIKNISLRLGFSDEHYFSKMFKKAIGVPPGKFRKS